MLLFLIFLLHIETTLVASSSSSSDLRPGFYSKTCPEAEIIVRDVMKKALIREPRSVASVMRFQFHDCFVNGETAGENILTSVLNIGFGGLPVLMDGYIGWKRQPKDEIWSWSSTWWWLFEGP